MSADLIHPVKTIHLLKAVPWNHIFIFVEYSASPFVPRVTRFHHQQ